jgi:hypothetical protein
VIASGVRDRRSVLLLPGRHHLIADVDGWFVN